MDLIWSVCENNKGGRPYAGLGSVVELQAPSSNPWRGISTSHTLQGPVDRPRAHPFAKLIVE